MYTCPLCSDYQNSQGGRLETHLKKVHSQDPEELYIQLYCNSSRPTCVCKEECAEPVKWFGWEKGYLSKYVRGHNARIFNAFSDPEVQKSNGQKRSEGYRTGKYDNPMKGQTKENNPKIAAAMELRKERYQNGDLVSWNKGLTKETSDKVAASAQKESESMSDKYATGELVPWNKGLTKEISPLVAEIASKVSDTLNNNQNSSSKRFKPEELKIKLEEFIEGKFALLTNLDDYRNKYQKLQFRCLVCESIQEKTIKMIISHPICWNCHPKESKAQLEIYDFIKNLCPDAKNSDRDLISPKELDILVPSKNFAIEYNGLYFHSEVCLKEYENYHYQKTLLAKDKGFQLFHIFEDEWLYKNSIVKSMLKVRLGFAEHKIFARKCIVKELSKQERMNFFNNNHINGNVANPKMSWGLFFNGVLVSAIYIRKPFHKKNYGDAFEIARFCCELNTVVVGALGKLVSTAKLWIKNNTPDRKLITYVDLEHGQGKGYEDIGFKFLHETVNKFWWTNFQKRFNRFHARADAKKGLSQKEVALSKGIWMIYGCPNRLLTMDI